MSIFFLCTFTGRGQSNLFRLDKYFPKQLDDSRQFTVKNSWRLSNRTIRRRLSHLVDRFFWCCCDQRLWFGLFRLGPPYYAYVVLDMTMTATLFVNKRIKWETITILIANVWSTMRLFAKNLVPALTEVWSTSISWTAGPILIELCGQLNYH